jgi:hypothetical protein
MPIVVAVLGVIIVVLGFVFFTVNPDEVPVTVPDTAEMNRTEEMEKAQETVVEDESLAESVTTQDDTVAEVALSKTFIGTGTYLTPSRSKHEVDVTLTLQAGLVTEVDVVYDNSDGYTYPQQERFDAAYKTLVVGKSLNEISLSRVGGASLTTNAFNEALAAIKSQQS